MELNLVEFGFIYFCNLDGPVDTRSPVTMPD